MTRLWSVTPGEEDGLLYTGGDPGVLFEPRRRRELGRTRALGTTDPTRVEPGAGGMCMHSIATWPGDPSRRAGDLGGRRVALRRRWPDVAARQQGPLPALHARGARTDTIDLCVHNMHRAPTRPERSSCSSMAGLPVRTIRESWTSIADACPPTSASRWCSIRTMRTAHLRHPARRGHGSYDAGRQGARLRDP